VNADALAIDQREDGVVFRVRVIPRAKRTEIVGALSGALKVKLTAPPVEGAANKALVRFLAETLGVSARQIQILSGHTSRQKLIRVGGVSADMVHRALKV
jgi:hypothetical protein